MVQPVGESLFGAVEEEEISLAEEAAAKTSAEGELKSKKAAEEIEEEGEEGGAVDAEALQEVIKELAETVGEEGEEEEGEEEGFDDHPVVKQLAEQNEELRTQQLELQSQLAELTDLAKKAEPTIESVLEGLEDDDTLSVGALKAVVKSINVGNNELKAQNQALQASVQEMQIRSDPKYKDYDKLIGAHGKNLMTSKEVYSMVMRAKNPPLALYLECKRAAALASSAEGSDKMKSILQIVKQARKSGRGAGKSGGSAKAPSTKKGALTYEQVQRMSPEQLKKAKVTDEMVYDLAKEAGEFE